MIVTIEFVKYFQASFLTKDKKLFSKHGIGCVANSSNLNEELG